MTRILIILLMTTAPLAAQAHGTRQMCLAMPGTSPEVCACAADALRTDVGAASAALYDRVSSVYVDMRSGGAGMGSAWDEALARIAQQDGTSQSDLKLQMKIVGRAHRSAVRRCR